MMLSNLNCLKTNDSIIRVALMKILSKAYEGDPETKIIEELGLKHGEARVDIAIVNGVIHGYELKSDLDTLIRLPNQMRIYNSVLDQITLVVSKNHLHEAIKLIPDWWGIIIAKMIDSNGDIKFCTIRKPEENHFKDSLSIAKLLWRKEALNILEKINQANGVRSKSRLVIYERLVAILDQKTLGDEVRRCLCTRIDWRSDLQCKPSDD